ncbi:hypothetical protein PoB_006166600 [Plakobranchus ocellatus]|uniref:Uncharacterized protein n=1 Tax=Plakobranchus ocellatus TaxID=259542 RepID=A0AAV4CTX2_9GAST|nr:hypothetical protein PoB_006166600 [Plakobranchus ocellatus]
MVSVTVIGVFPRLTPELMVSVTVTEVFPRLTPELMVSVTVTGVFPRLTPTWSRPAILGVKPNKVRPGATDTHAVQEWQKNNDKKIFKKECNWQENRPGCTEMRKTPGRSSTTKPMTVSKPIFFIEKHRENKSYHTTTTTTAPKTTTATTNTLMIAPPTPLPPPSSTQPEWRSNPNYFSTTLRDNFVRQKSCYLHRSNLQIIIIISRTT